MSTKGCGHWDKRAGRHFRTGIDLGLLSGVGIKQNNQRFMACTLHVPSIDCSKARVMDSVVSNSSPGFPSPYEVCSVLNHRVYTKVLSAFSGLLRSLFTLSDKNPQTNWHVEHLYYTCLSGSKWVGININGLRWCAVTCHSGDSKGPLSILLTHEATNALKWPTPGASKS